MISTLQVKPFSMPSNLRNDLPQPHTPWLISERVFQSMESPTPSALYKRAMVFPGDKEWRFIWRYFHADKPTRYGIKRIWCVHERHKQEVFQFNLSDQEREAKTFPPTWKAEPRAEQRALVIDRWTQETDAFSPFHSQEADGRNRTWKLTKILPLWHGTSREICESICSSGFVFFGKKSLGSAIAGDPKSTDEGFFGSGIYFTNSPRYAADIYSKGHMLLAWVSMRHPFPVVGDPQQLDMAVLKGHGAYKSYNAHYVPVVPIEDDPDCNIYCPAKQGELPVCDEYVVFHKSQTLPRYWIELEVEVPYLMTLSDVPQFVQELIPHLKHILQNPDVDKDLKLRNVLGKELEILLKLPDDDDLNDRQIQLYHHLTELLIQDKVNKALRNMIVGMTASQTLEPKSSVSNPSQSSSSAWMQPSLSLIPGNAFSSSSTSSNAPFIPIPAVSASHSSHSASVKHLDPAPLTPEKGKEEEEKSSPAASSQVKKKDAALAMSSSEESKIPISSIGKAEWAAPHLIKNLPAYSQELKEFLAGDCTIWPGKKRSETHIVVPLFKYITAVVNGSPILVPRTIKTLNELDKSSGGVGCRYIWDEILKTDQNRPAGEFHYGVLTKDVLPETRSKSYNNQKALVESKGYQVPPLLEATTAILWENRRTGARLFSDAPLAYTRCIEQINSYQLVVGAFAPGGLSVSSLHCDSARIGVAGFRKF